jgi:dihydrodipicolinate synthase/N-acetylneuraminate lyase
MDINRREQYVIVPLVTPLTENYALDEAAVEKILVYIQEDGCQPFILGTTGEASSLPFSVKKAYISKAVSLKNKFIPLYVGIGSNCVNDSVELARLAFDMGADTVVATLPSYYQLTDSQMMQYFEKLADSIPGSLMIYNIPSTTHMSIPLKVIDELSRHEKIVGVKDSERSDDRLNQSLDLWSKREDFGFYVGWAARSAYALEKGCHGIVPSTGNINPELYTGINFCVYIDDMENANRDQKISDQLGDIYQSGKTLGESLAALKALMKIAGFCDSHMMPPLEKVSPEEEIKLRKAYKEIIP